MGSDRRRRGFSALSAVLTFLMLTGAGGYLLLAHPDTPLPPEWNPAVPLDVTAPATPVTSWKLARAQEGQACLSALATDGGSYSSLPDIEETPRCHIRDRVRVTEVAGIALSPVETRCQTALRLALWVRHGVEPSAREVFGIGGARLHHLSSYNCRPIRTASGAGSRMSSHATADAIDITGVTLADGRRIDLNDDWNGDNASARFLRLIRDHACDWFDTVLGPDFNDLHAGHFHLQSTGWGTCR